MHDIPTITLTDAEAMMAREAIRRTYAGWENNLLVRGQAVALIARIDERRAAALRRHYRPHRRALRWLWRRLRRLGAWYWKRCPEWAAGAGLLAVAGLLWAWALVAWLG